MSEIETIKLIADAGVGIVSLIVLIIVIRTGASILRTSDARMQTAEESRDAAMTARTDAERRESEAVARHAESLAMLEAARHDLKLALEHCRGMQEMLTVEMSKVRELRIENARLMRERAELLTKIDTLEGEIATLNRRVAELERDATRTTH